MIQTRISHWLVLVMLGFALAIPGAVQAQSSATAIEVDESTGDVQLILGTSRVLKFGFRVPELVVENQDTLQATPIAANQILITGKKIGFSSITVTDEEQNPLTINVHVMGDVRKLEATLHSLFPDSRIHATALNTSVVLQGTAASASQVPVIISTANDFFPTVHNNLTIGDSQLVAIEVKVFEVSRSKLRELGIDWQLATSSTSIASSVAGVGPGNFSFSILNNGNQFLGFLQALERNSLAKLLDSPVLVAMNGRPAEFLEGGEIPFEVNQGLGQNSIEFRPFGTKLDVVPIVLGQNRVRLEVRAEVSEPAADLTSSNGTPGFRVRRVNTGVEMKMGHTLALAGDYREEVEAETSGFPVLKSMPYIGAAFRRVRETTTELELVIMLTPRFVAETDPSNLPPLGPGQLTASPSDCELYLKGHIEVPRCKQDCPGPQGFLPAQPVQYQNGTTSYTNNPYLEERPKELPKVLQDYQQYHPASQQVPQNTQPQSGFGYPTNNNTAPQTPLQPGSTWPAGNVTPPSNSTWPTPTTGARNAPETPSYNVSSRRKTYR